MTPRIWFAAGAVLVVGLLAVGMRLWTRTSGSTGLDGGPESRIAPANVLEAEMDASRTAQVLASDAAAAATEAAPLRDDSIEALAREGAHRDWRLPKISELNADDLLGSKGVRLDRALSSELQERMREPVVKLQTLFWSRVSTQTRFCTDQVAAGLATEIGPHGKAPDDGKEHVTGCTVKGDGTPFYWSVSIAPGDCPELDAIDRDLAQTWGNAVLDLRNWFDAHRH